MSYTSDMNCVTGVKDPNILAWFQKTRGHEGKVWADKLARSLEEQVFLMQTLEHN